MGVVVVREGGIWGKFTGNDSAVKSVLLAESRVERGFGELLQTKSKIS